MKFSLPFAYSMSLQTAENLENNLSFVDERILAFQINQNKQCLEIEISDASLKNEIIEKVNQLMEKLKPMREFEPSVVFDNLQATPTCQDDIFKRLIDRGDIRTISSGLYAVQGLPMKMIDHLNRKVIAFAQELQAEEVLYPVLSPIEDLRQASFFKRTPQHANFVTLFSEDGGKISDFCKVLDAGDAQHFFEYFNQPTHICRSAICSNSYSTYRNQTLKNEELICLTTWGRAFRNEAKNVQSLERLHEFSMREVIFYGNKENVANGLEKAMNWFQKFIKELSLQAVIKTAGDPFYADNVTALQFYQFAEQSKFEVRLVNPFSGNEVSCGSLNNHGHHFAKSFDIKLENGDFATTGCVGWGFERTVFLILSQFGLDTSTWPAPLKANFPI